MRSRATRSRSSARTAATESATIVGRDPSTDIAFAACEGAGTGARVRRRRSLRVGAIVLAVARDDDGDLAATMGVLSAVGEAGARGTADRSIVSCGPTSRCTHVSRAARSSTSPVARSGSIPAGLSRRQVLTVPAATIERVVQTLLAAAAGSRTDISASRCKPSTAARSCWASSRTARPIAAV